MSKVFNGRKDIMLNKGMYVRILFRVVLFFLLMSLILIRISSGIRSILISVSSVIVGKELDLLFWGNYLVSNRFFIVSILAVFFGFILTTDLFLGLFHRFEGFCVHLITENKTIYFIILSVVICTADVIMIELSTISIYSGPETLTYCLNIVLVLVFFLFLFSIFQNWILTSVILTTVLFLISIVNHYVTLFHGVALNPQDISDAGTAYNVISGYKLTIDGGIVKIVIIYGLILLFIFFQHRINCISNSVIMKPGLKKRMIICFIGVVISLFSFLNLIKLLDSDGIGADWSWEYSISKNGFIFEFTKAGMKILLQEFVECPNGYTDNNTKQLLLNYNTNDPVLTEPYPDIIFILNESWYDLSLVCDIDTDVDYMENFKKLNCISKGYAVVPNIGGGTNRSEYEFLTSNSLSILQKDITPFNWLKFNNETYSSIYYLRKLGYLPMAIHCAPGSNYRRDRVWQELGFERTYFIDSFSEQESGYGERNKYLDKDLLDEFQSKFSELDNDKPHFGYILTIQNHGPYDISDRSYDTVHVKNDLGKSTEEINEYLTSIKLTDDFIDTITDYYSKVDRKTIIVMVGDHAPSFIKDVANKKFENELQLEIAEKSTPYFIWTNFEIDNRESGSEKNRIDLCALAPLALECTGLPETQFYNSVLDLEKNNILHSSSNVESYVTNEGKVNDAGKYEEILRRYFYLEYNSIGIGTERIEDAFIPKTVSKTEGE